MNIEVTDSVAPDRRTAGLRLLARTVDERLAELFAARREENRNVASAEDSIRLSAGQGRVWNGRRSSWAGTLQDALAAHPSTPWVARQHADAVACRNAALARLAVIEKEIAEGDAVYAELRWNRAFLVTSSNGHVHKMMACSTCRPATEFAWLPQYSGAAEEEIVADAGETACTVCYPSAPADVLNRPSRIVTQALAAQDAARAQRQAVKAARVAKRKAAAPTASGEPLEIPEQFNSYTMTVKTERAARVEWNLSRDSVTELSSPRWLDRARERMAVIEAALADKHKMSPEEMREDLEAKYAKRRR